MNTDILRNKRDGEQAVSMFLTDILIGWEHSHSVSIFDIYSVLIIFYDRRCFGETLPTYSGRIGVSVMNQSLRSCLAVKDVSPTAKNTH
jgi:hypothetical protein